MIEILIAFEICRGLVEVSEDLKKLSSYGKLRRFFNNREAARDLAEMNKKIKRLIDAFLVGGRFHPQGGGGLMIFSLFSGWRIHRARSLGQEDSPNDTTRPASPCTRSIQLPSALSRIWLF
jgi:hypothetical protein